MGWRQNLLGLGMCHILLVLDWNRVRLAGLRSQEKTVGRPPPWAGKKTKEGGRDVPTSSIPSRVGSSVRPGDIHRPGFRDCPSSTVSVSVPGRSSTVGSEKERDLGKRPAEGSHRRGDVISSSNPIRARDDLTSSLKQPEAHPLILEGVNQRENVESFWDSSDFGIGVRKGMKIVSDHDMAHLVPHSFSTLVRSLALNSCQNLSLVRALECREDKSREDMAKLRRESAKLKEDAHRLEAEKVKLQEEINRLSKTVEVKTKESNDFRHELSALYEKYASETKTGQQFLVSTEGEVLKKSLGKEAVATYCLSPDFVEEVYRRAFDIRDQVVLDCRRILRETGLVSEEIVMMLYPQVTEVVEDLAVLPAGVPLDDIGDLEIIEALDSLPADDPHDES